MRKDDSADECFGPKHLSTEEPDDTWEIERLGEHARIQHDQIIRGEKSLAPYYWELGRALQIAKRQVRRGQWLSFLTAYGINRVRACRARAIFRSHPTAEAVAGLSVEEAYEHRVKRQSPRRRNQGEPDAQNDEADPWLSRERTEEGLTSFLTHVRLGAEEFVDVAAFLEKDRRSALCSLHLAAVERLQYLGRLLGVGDQVGPDNVGRADCTAASHLDGNDESSAPCRTPEADGCDDADKELEQGGSS